MELQTTETKDTRTNDNIEQHTTVVELETTETKDTTNDNVEQHKTAVELQTAETTEDDTPSDDVEQHKTAVELQKMMLKSRPTVRDLMNKKVTWREFLGVYNILRIGIAAFFGVLIWLSMFGMAYALNPNTCKKQRTTPHRLQYHPFANMIILAWVFSLAVIPIVKIGGHEFLFSHKKINIFSLIVIFIVFITFTSYGFLLNVALSTYLNVTLSVITGVCVIYLFVTSGFYIVWLLFPFMVVAILAFMIIFGFNWLFYNAITPASPFFGVTYTLMITVLESTILKFTYFAFPYNWGKWCTCPWNRNKLRRIVSSAETQLSDLILYYYSMIFMAAIESMRVTGYVLVKDEHFGFGGLIVMVISSIVFECIARNNLMWEILYKCILKKEVCPAWGRTYCIWYGAKYQGEYIPIWCILFMTLFKYGPFKQCGHVRDAELADNVNINGDYWFFFVMFAAEFFSDVVAEIVLKIGRYFKWFGVKDENNEDLPRKTTLVKVNLIPSIWIHVHCYLVAFIAFGFDNSIRSQRMPLA